MGDSKTTPMQLYGLGPRCWKVLITANYAGVPIEVMPIQMGVTNKTPEYLSKCVTGKVRKKWP
jgi:glutathione S-transferase